MQVLRHGNRGGLFRLIPKTSFLYSRNSSFPSRRCISNAPSASSTLNSDELEQLVALLESDPRVLMEVVNHLNPEHRRRLVVAGGAMEWFGADSTAQEMERADVDKDRQISPKDFDHWFENALKRKVEEQKKKSEGASAELLLSSAPPLQSSLQSSPALLPESKSTGASPPFRTLALIAVEAGLPFVGFGFLDNAAMILAGDAIDGSIGFYLNCSVLASAAMGNVCSGLLGMQVHGVIEKGVRRVFHVTPILTEASMRHRRVFLAGHIGGTVGIMIGLLLGMLPLLFLDTDSSDTEKSDYVIFQKLDHNSSGSIELPEFARCLDELGLKDAHERARDLLQKYGDGKQLDFEQFEALRADLREGRAIF